YQEVPHEPLFRSTTKQSLRVDEAGQVPHILYQAFRDAVTGRPGPVHIDVAGHTGDAIASAVMDPYSVKGRACSSVPGFRPPAPASLVDEAARLIARAERPVIVADQGVCISRAEQAVRRLAEHASIPVV